MFLYGYFSSDPLASSKHRRILHQSLDCPGVTRAASVFDGAAWSDPVSGELTVSKASNVPVVLCGMVACQSSESEGFDFELAACRGMDSDIFFPAHNNGNPYDRARVVCRRCPVKAECLDYAVSRRLPYGMFGGLAPEERRKLKVG